MVIDSTFPKSPLGEQDHKAKDATSNTARTTISKVIIVLSMQPLLKDTRERNGLPYSLEEFPFRTLEPAMAMLKDTQS